MKGSLGKFFGYLAIGTITLGVLLFLGSHSLNFFQFTFTEDDEIYAWLGLLLTSGGVIGWLVIFESLAQTTIQRGISLVMMLVGLFGEMATAVFDMRYSAVYGTFTFTDTELGQMTLLIGILGAMTGLCLIGFFGGDHIIRAFKDDDGDGIPNIVDRHDNRKDNRKEQKHANGAHPHYEMPDFLNAYGMTPGQAKAHWVGKDYGAFAGEVSQKLDISGKNMKKIYYQLFPTQGGSRNN